MSEYGIIPYDLTPPRVSPWEDRHYCIGRPDIDKLPDGQTWECCDCGSTWTPRTEEDYCPDCCGECGHKVTVRRWETVEGDRIGTAPRYPVYRWTPFRNLISRPVSASLPLGSCYRMASGAMVHVKPGCRC